MASLLQSENFPCLKRGALGSCMQIESKYLERAGLSSKGDVTYVMVRKDVHDLFSFLEVATQGPCFCYVTGAPGTGKSFASFAFMCTILDRGYNVSWIHVYDIMPALCIRFVDGKIIHRELPVEQIAEFLRSAAGDRTHILFVDGITSESRNLETICCAWMREDQEKRPVVLIASMAAGARFSADERRRLNYREFPFFSWSYDEYRDLELIKNKQFFEQVEGKLDAHVNLSCGLVTGGAGSKRRNPDSCLTDEEKLASKFHFAGGSSRAMFDMTTSEVVENIRKDVSRAENIFSYLSGTVSECSHIAVNHLISWYSGNGSSTRCTPVSAHAASAIAQKLGPQMVSSLRKALKPVLNPFIDGTLFEMWIFAKLHNEGLKYQEKKTSESVWSEKEWKGSGVLDFDPHGKMPAITNASTWLKPIKWQQGGYDAVQINSETKSITFLQITRSSSHSFKTEYFEQLLLQIKHVWELNIQFLEIYFVVPRPRASNFRVESPTDPGLFFEYCVPGGTIKWEKGSEVNHVKICSVDDLQDP